MAAPVLRSSATLKRTSTTGRPRRCQAPHNDADVAFAEDMIPHHEQAIVMSDILLAKQGIDPRVVELAEQIKAGAGSRDRNHEPVARAMGRAAAGLWARRSRHAGWLIIE